MLNAAVNRGVFLHEGAVIYLYTVIKLYGPVSGQLGTLAGVPFSELQVSELEKFIYFKVHHFALTLVILNCFFIKCGWF